MCVCPCVHACVCRMGGNKGVQHWGMCTCNFSRFTQLLFCRVLAKGGRRHTATQSSDDHVVWPHGGYAGTHRAQAKRRKKLPDPCGRTKKKKDWESFGRFEPLRTKWDFKDKSQKCLFANQLPCYHFIQTVDTILSFSFIQTARPVFSTVDSQEG